MSEPAGDLRESADREVTALALAARDGDRPALGEFIRLTHKDVWRFVAHLTRTELADDLTQEVYLRAMDALPRFQARSSARSWLLAIARHTVVDAVRREVARPSLPVAQHRRDTPRLVVADATGEVDLALLLAGLGAPRREAFVLTQVLGYSYAEAAEVCGVRVGTIRSRVARARDELATACRPASSPAARAG